MWFFNAPARIPKMIEDKLFERIDFTETPFIIDEYENCRFVGCNLFQANLSNVVFRECSFEECDVSMANLNNTTLNDVKFKGCKLVGLQFENCKTFLFSVSCEHCVLKLAVFYQTKLKKTLFRNCNLQEVDFTEADLTESVLDNCDLMRATFNYTILEKADLRTSYLYSIDPVINRLKKARFSRQHIDGLLDRFDIKIE